MTALTPSGARGLESHAMGVDAATAVASTLKALAEPLRLRMLSAIATSPDGEVTVGELATLTDVSQPTVSHHLKVLRDVGLLTADRRGTSVCSSSRVESTHRSESSPGIGGRRGNDPVATIAERNVTSSPPSTAIVFGPVNVPAPFTHSTPFVLKSDATPPVICFTTASFHSFARGKSSCASETATPVRAEP